MHPRRLPRGLFQSMLSLPSQQRLPLSCPLCLRTGLLLIHLLWTFLHMSLVATHPHFSGGSISVELPDQGVGICLALSRDCQIVFQSACANFQSHQQCLKVPVALHSHQHLVFLVFLNFSHSDTVT